MGLAVLLTSPRWKHWGYKKWKLIRNTNYSLPLYQISLLVYFSSVISLVSASNQTFPLTKPGCEDKCGNVTIPYPFGMTENCYYSRDFHITCNKTRDPPTAFLRNGNVSVTEIRLDGKLNIRQYVARDCYNKTGNRTDRSRPWIFLDDFIVSDTDNKFVAIGCDTQASILGLQEGSKIGYRTGCLLQCLSKEYVTNGSCTGIGCCELSLAKGVNYYNISIGSFQKHEGILDFNPCSYAFVVQKDEYSFTANHLSNLEDKQMPVVLDWAIRNVTCEEAKANIKSYACQGKSHCVPAGNGSGYRCLCRKGYDGNPYLSNGCQDIKECDDENLNNCTHRCNELEGGYKCSCPKGYRGDGRKDGHGCTRSRSLVIQLTVGIGSSLLVLLASSAWTFFGYKKWKLIKLKEKFFRLNGGLMLQQELSSREGSTRETAKIFSAEELKKATNNYDETKVIGIGGYGTVYKGILTDGRTVAIKKSKVVDQSQIDQFINEVIVLSQINHRNVVKLLGCCLETEVPLLVYEYITNGTLFDHIHDKSKALMMNWETRLRIAGETAGVLSYLHSSASIPIIHRDVKPTNILLDDSYTAKVSDFGASRLVPLDQAGISTMVQGTLGYLDPEYLHTSQLTEKSDVYSFGVVFIELLTGEKAISYERPEEERNLAMYFVSALKQDRLCQVLEECVVKECKLEHIKEVADLAKRCLQVRGDERPTMREVAMELEGIIRETVKHPQTNKETCSEETAYLLGDYLDSAESKAKDSGGASSGYDSIKDHLILSLEESNGR